MILAEATSYLATQGIGTAATNLFYGILEPHPDALVALFEYGGMENEHTLGSRVVNIEWPSIQAVSRGIPYDYDGPRLKIQDVVTAFAKICDQPLIFGGVKYGAIIAKQPPFFLRRDDNFRVEFACNFQIMRSYSAT